MGFRTAVHLTYLLRCGKLLEGKIKSNKLKLVEAWIEIHNEELMADWELAINSEPMFKIDPLK